MISDSHVQEKRLFQMSADPEVSRFKSRGYVVVRLCMS